MHVRPYRASDWSDWLRMSMALFPGASPEEHAADMRAWLARADARVFVAERPDGSIAGYVEVGTRPYADGCETSPVGYIEAWYVDADVRRAGYGRALLAAAEAWSRDRGYREMASDAVIDNVVSEQAHVRAGYSVVDRVTQFRKAIADARPVGGPGAPVRRVPSGEDREGERREFGVSAVDFKVSGQGPDGLFVIEHRCHIRSGPARHLHYAQDQWFYAVDGEFLVEIGTERTTLGPGDSLFAPRQVPHVWACVGRGHGRLLVVFNPAGTMEMFLREVAASNAISATDPALWRTYGMELVGPPLVVDA